MSSGFLMENQKNPEVSPAISSNKLPMSSSDFFPFNFHMERRIDSEFYIPVALRVNFRHHDGNLFTCAGCDKNSLIGFSS